MDTATPVTGNTTFDHILTIIGALVPLFSAIASFLNHKVRVGQNEGKDASSALLGMAATLNVLSVNLDKASQMVRLIRGQEVEHTEKPADGAAGAGDVQP